jgi:hypothetical protein
MPQSGRKRQFAVQFSANVGNGQVSTVLNRALRDTAPGSPTKTRLAPRVERRPKTRIPRKKRSQSKPANRRTPRCTMINVTEIVALLRRQAELEFRILAGRADAVATERKWGSTRRGLIAHPEAFRAVLETARALQRTPDAASAPAERSPRSHAANPHPPSPPSPCRPACAQRRGHGGNDEWSTAPGRALSVQYADVQERWNVGTATTGSPRTGPGRTGAGAPATGPPRRDCRSQYSVCRPRRSMDTVGGCGATDRANRPGAPEMPPNITPRTRNRMTALLAR